MNLKTTMLAGLVTSILLAQSAVAQSARDHINVVGSSTVYPFSTVVAERFGKGTKFKTPKIESTGSGGGLKLFCAGVGVEHPDITNSSRRIKKSEMRMCADNGVTGVVEVKVGYDGIVFASSTKSKSIKLTRKQLFTALAKQIPDANGKLIDNPNTTWKQIDAGLPDSKIEVLGPPPTSGTRDAFVELVMEKGCSKYDSLKQLKKSDRKMFKAVCHSVREDGAYVEAGENDNLIVQKLDANPAAFGIFGFSFLDQNADKLQGNPIENVEPTFEAIADGSYPVSRPLYFYVKSAHVDVIPGMREFLAEFTSDKAWGEDGYLADKGMIPMPGQEREKFAADAAALTNLSM
jgi:phosphate transport system substrate-binding protein